MSPYKSYVGYSVNTQVNKVFNYRMNYYSTVCGFETFNYDLKQRDSIEV